MALKKHIVPIVNLPKPKDKPVDEYKLLLDTYKDQHKSEIDDFKSNEARRRDEYRKHAAAKMKAELAMQKIIAAQNGIALGESTDDSRRELNRILKQIEEMEDRYRSVKADSSLSDEDRRIQLEAISRDIRAAKKNYDMAYSTRAKDIGYADAHDEDITSLKSKYGKLGVKKGYEVLQQFKAAHPEEYKDLKKMAIKGAVEYVKDNAVSAARDYLDSQSRHRAAKKQSKQYPPLKFDEP